MARKKYQGAIKDKDRSMQKLIDAVGVVITTSGYTGLTATNIAKAAVLDRKLISLYFGSTEQLIETYIRQRDCSVRESSQEAIRTEVENATTSLEVLEKLLVRQLDYFDKDQEMQKIVLWQISEHSEIMKRVCEEREKLSEAFFSTADKDPTVKDVDIRATVAILASGLYYLVLQGKTGNGTFCEIDPGTPEGIDRIREALKVLLRSIYKEQQPDLSPAAS